MRAEEAVEDSFTAAQAAQKVSNGTALRTTSFTAAQAAQKFGMATA